MGQTFWTAVGSVAGVVAAGAAVWVIIYSGTSNESKPKVDSCVSASITECREMIRINPQNAIDACQKYANCDSSNPNAFALLGQANRVAGRHKAAQAAYERQLILGQSRKDDSVISNAYYNLYFVYLDQNSLDNAEHVLKRSLEINLRGNNFVGQAANYRGFGDVDFKRGNFASAESNYSKAIEISTRIDDKVGLGNAYVGMGFTKIRRGDRITGCSFFRQAREKFAETNFMRGLNDIEGHLSKNNCRV